MSDPDKRLILLGASGHCRACIDVIEQCGTYKIEGLIDKTTPAATKSLDGYAIIGNDRELEKIRQRCHAALIAVGQIGTSAIRVKLFERLKSLGYELPVIVAPSAYVSPRAEIAEGTIIMHHALVNAGARVGANCILNSGCVVEHDVHIGDHTHVSTGSVVNGSAIIGARSFIGSGATVVQGVKLPDSCFVRAGSLVCSERDGRPIDEHRS